MMEYYSALGPTVKKIIALVALAPVVFIIGAVALADGALAGTLVLGFLLGMAFPDLDVFTGWIRTTFQTMLLIIFLGAGIFFYPYAWNLGGGFCPIGVIKSAAPGLDGVFVCKIGLAGILALAAYVLAWLAVSWLPSKNSFHSWGSAVMFAGGLGLINRATATASNPWPITAGFAAGYFIHILLDGKKTPEGESIIGPIPKNAPPIMKKLRF